ncbi:MULTISPECIES: CBS domain-containing protein [unclassified Aureimonas]|uniref:CBS domain-containing protein n=1 Tax=unclassified Aureimonas TaxID=2615206 RepID=UPI0006F405A9|nr:MULTISPECIES: CBS domain-containing protein [unclassified Aureimonas]KQT57521.1 inosine-5-monophosphate dehydrogenase [Aureimonas sp. Leaf427]KQT77202.1 inosine-5-monophosphate dehydrogenase [Aureimonas sp. Leaf460]
MSIKHILEEKGRQVFTMTPSSTLEEAARELSSRKIGALILTDDGGRISGILSERDIVRMIARNGADCLGQSIANVMTTKVVTCTEAMSIDEVMEIMTAGRFRHVPVEENGRLVGVISIGDVVKKRIEEAVQEAEQMRTYIAAG